MFLWYRCDFTVHFRKVCKGNQCVSVYVGLKAAGLLSALQWHLCQLLYLCHTVLVWVLKCVCMFTQPPGCHDGSRRLFFHSRQVRTYSSPGLPSIATPWLLLLVWVRMIPKLRRSTDYCYNWNNSGSFEREWMSIETLGKCVSCIIKKHGRINVNECVQL